MKAYSEEFSLFPLVLKLTSTEMWIFHHQNYLVTRLLNEPWNCLHFQKDSWNVSWEITQSIYRKGSNSCSWFWIIYQLWPQNIYRYCINKCSIITHHSKQSGSTHWWLDGEGPGNECVAYLTSMQWTCDFILWKWFSNSIVSSISTEGREICVSNCEVKKSF